MLTKRSEEQHEDKENFGMTLNVKGFAITCALIWGLGLFFLTWWIIVFEGATGAKTFLGMVYRGYNISPVGSVIGLAWAFVDGLIGGAIFAWLYNRFTACPYCTGGAATDD